MSPGPIDVRRDGGWVFVRWQGEIDTANAAVVETATLRAIQNADEGVTIDLSAVEYIDSAGLRTLLTIHRSLSHRQQRLTLALRPTSPLQKTLDVSGVAAVIPIHEPT